MARLKEWKIKDVVFCLEQMQNNKFDCICVIEGNRGLGKCLDSKTRVKRHNAKTVTSPSKQLGNYNIGDEINTLSFDFENNKTVFSKSKVIDKSKKMLFKVKLKNGKEVVCSEEHRLFIENKGKIYEKKLKELKKGDKLICL